jgi:hypothetical protein
LSDYKSFGMNKCDFSAEPWGLTNSRQSPN